MSTLAHSSQSAPVQEYRVLWTAQKKQKLKRWHDGFLRLHTFNNRMLLYDEGRNLVSDKYNKPGEPLHEGDELEFEQHLVTIEEFIRTVVQDLTPVFSPAIQRKQQRNAASVHNTPIRMPTGAGALTTPLRTPAHAQSPHGTRNSNPGSASVVRPPTYGQSALAQHAQRTPNTAAPLAPPRIPGGPRTAAPSNPMSRVNGTTGSGAPRLQQASGSRFSAQVAQNQIRPRPHGPVQQPAQPPRITAQPQRAPQGPIQPVVRPNIPNPIPPPEQQPSYAPQTQETPTPAQRPAPNYRMPPPPAPRFERVPEARPPAANRSPPSVRPALAPIPEPRPQPAPARIPSPLKASPPRQPLPPPQPASARISSPPRISPPRPPPHPARRSKIPPSPNQAPPKHPPPPPPEAAPVGIDDLIDLIDDLDDDLEDEVPDPPQEPPKPASRKPKFRPPTRQSAPVTPPQPPAQTVPTDISTKPHPAISPPPPALHDPEPPALLKLPTATKRPRNKLLSRGKPTPPASGPPPKRFKPNNSADNVPERIEATPPPEETGGKPWDSQMVDEDLDIRDIEEMERGGRGKEVEDWPGKEEGYDRTGPWTVETAFLFDFKRPRKK